MNSVVKNLIASYNAIKDESWPDCVSYAELEQLPKHIIDECRDVHGFDFLINRSQLKLLNPYYPGVPFETYPDLDNRLSQHFDYIYDSYFPFSISPRFFYQSGIKFTLRDTYWYIDQLYKSNPTSVIDLGCGENGFKNWFPHIFGVDQATNPWSQADLIGDVDDKFFKEHQGRYDCGMCIHAVFSGWHRFTDLIHSMMGLVNNSFFFACPIITETFNDLPLELKSNFDLMITTLIDRIYNSGYEVTLLDFPDYLTLNWDTSWQGVSYRRAPHSNLRFMLKHKK